MDASRIISSLCSLVGSLSFSLVPSLVNHSLHCTARPSLVVFGTQNGAPIVGIDLNVGIVKNARGSHPGHQSSGNPHGGKEGIRGWIGEPILLVKGFRLEFSLGRHKGVVAGGGGKASQAGAAPVESMKRSAVILDRASGKQASRMVRFVVPARTNANSPRASESVSCNVGNVKKLVRRDIRPKPQNG